MNVMLWLKRAVAACIVISLFFAVFSEHVLSLLYAALAVGVLGIMYREKQQ